MKKFTYSKKFIYIAILICFILGQLAGSFLIKTIFINYKLKDMLPQAINVAATLAKGETPIILSGAFIIKAYDLNGTQIKMADKKISPKLFNVTEEEFRTALIPYIPEVTAGEQFAEIRDISGLPSRSIIIGTPIVKQGKTIGILFLLEPTSEFQAVLNGFYLVFTATLLVGTLFIGYFLSSYLNELKKLEKVRQDYIANISHELKSPIASIRALTETLSDGLVRNEDKVNNYYSIILSECARLQRLIYDILELSRMQNNQTIWDKQAIPTDELIAFIDSKYSFLSDEMGIDFEITDQARTLPVIYSNKDKLIQLINILVDNALKFVGEDGKIIVDAEVHTKYITIRIIDNGSGISTEDLPYIFDRFYKSEKSHNGKGSGLGLSIARTIVSGLDETIVARSEYGVGSIFEFTVKRHI